MATVATRLKGAAALALMAPLMLGSVDLRTKAEDRLLAAHNRERTALDIPPLRWDSGLAADAAEWAEVQRRIGYLKHSPSDPRDPDPQGENLWAGTKGHYSLESMVGLWIAERKHFKPGIFPANSRTGDLADVAHYTQVMWRSSTHVGCAMSSNGRDDFLVCRYSEGGNVIGERPF